MKTKNDVLELVEKKLTLETDKELDPKEFFQTRDGLYVWSDFKERILGKADTITAGESISVESYRLLEYATDETIEKALPKDHIFSEKEVCLVIAELISKQSKGEEGALLNTGYANLFYTPAFVVSVGWLDAYWSVGTWERHDDEWDGLDRVFSPAN